MNAQIIYFSIWPYKVSQYGSYPKGFGEVLSRRKNWKMVLLQLWCAWNTNIFAILQKNQDKRPLRATPTPFHLSLKTLSGRLKRICHLAKHVKQVWQRFITKGIWKTRLIFILIFTHIQYFMLMLMLLLIITYNSKWENIVFVFVFVFVLLMMATLMIILGYCGLCNQSNSNLECNIVLLTSLPVVSNRLDSQPAAQCKLILFVNNCQLPRYKVKMLIHADTWNTRFYCNERKWWNKFPTMIANSYIHTQKVRPWTMNDIHKIHEKILRERLKTTFTPSKKE